MHSIYMVCMEKDLPTWYVFAGRPANKSAQFPSTVYGKSRAKKLAEKFLEDLRSGGTWDELYFNLPIK